MDMDDLDYVDRMVCNVFSNIRAAASDEDTDNGKHFPEALDGTPVRKLFISNLAQRTTYKDLTALFSKYGPVESCYLNRTPNKKNYAFVTFFDVSAATRAGEDGYRKQIRLHNRDLRVLAANAWHQPDSVENVYFRQARSESCAFDSNESDETTDRDSDRSSILRLNDDCLKQIFTRLPLFDRVRIERVCKRWRALSHESWRLLKRVDLSTGTWGSSPLDQRLSVDTYSLRKVLLRCGEFVHHLDVSRASHRLSQDTLAIVGKLCPNLRTIDVTSLTISGAGIGSLAAHCRLLTHVSLGRADNCYDSDLIKLFEANQHLRSLKMKRNDITGRCLAHLPSGLEELVLHRCRGLEPSLVCDALAKLSNLTSFALNAVATFTGDMAKVISVRCTNLKSLELIGPSVRAPAEDVGLVRRLDKLETLGLSGNAQVNDRVLATIFEGCRRLRHVDISGCKRITDDALAALAVLPGLESLAVNYANRVTSAGLARLTNLRRLECRGCPGVGDDGVTSVLGNNPLLELLDVSGCAAVTSVALLAAIDLVNARANSALLKMYVGGTGVRREDVGRVAPCLLVLNVDLAAIDARATTCALAHPDDEDAERVEVAHGRRRRADDEEHGDRVDGTFLEERLVEREPCDSEIVYEDDEECVDDAEDVVEGVRRGRADYQLRIYWSLIAIMDEMRRENESSRINRPEGSG